MAVISVVAIIALWLQEDSVFQTLDDGGGKYTGLVVTRGHDCTPLELSFGALSGDLAPYARYSVLEDGQYVSKTYDQMQTIKRGALTYGRVELFAQTCKLGYSEFDASCLNENIRHKRKLVLLPNILERGSASCVNEGFERAVPALSIAGLNAIAENQDSFALLSECPDHHSSNGLKRKYSARQAGPLLLYPPGGCCAHRLTRINHVAFDLDKTIGDVYVTQYVCQSPVHANKNARALWQQVQDMDITYLAAGQEPDAECTRYLKEVLRYTTRRRYDLVHGRVEHDGSFFSVKGSKERDEKDARLIEMLAGVDIRTSKLQHMERGCCPDGVAQIKSKMYTAIIEGGLLISGQNFQLPSKHRVGSMTQANADQMAGVMLCNVLPRTILAAFRTWLDGDPGEGVTDDFRLMMKRKVWRLIHAQDPLLLERRIWINWVSIELDQAWIKIQHMDARGGALLELTRRHTNPFHHAADQFALMIFTDIGTGPLATLFWFVSGNNEYTNEPVDQVRKLVLELSLQCQWHFSKFDQEPFTLVAFGDATRTCEELLERARAFKDKFECCRDPDMEEKVWQRYPEPEDLCECIDFRLLMSNWGEEGLWPHVGAKER